MRKTLVFAIVASVMWLSPPGVGAVDYYVSPNGSGDQYIIENPGYLNEVNALVLPGDTVWLMDGTYEDVDGIAISPERSGTSDNYITYTNYNGGTPILKNKGKYDATSGQRGLIIANNIDYIKIENITINSPYDGSYIVVYECDHWRFINCTATIINGLSSRSIKLMYSTHLYFIDCYFDASDITEEVYNDLVKNYGSSYLLFLRTYFGSCTHASFQDYGGSYLVFKDCIIENKFHTGLFIKGNRCLVDNCTFENMGSLPNPNNLNDNGHDPAIYQTGRYAIVRNNLFYDNNNHWNTRSDSPYIEFEYNWIYNNTMFNALEYDYTTKEDMFYTGAAWFIGTGEEIDNQMQYNHIINNIVWKAEEEIQIAFNYVGTPNDPHDNIISHNIVGDPVNSAMIRWRDSLGSSGETLELAEANNEDWIVGTNIESDPLFTNESTQDFTLKSTSPAIDTGTWLTTITSATANNQTSIALEDATPFYSGAGSPWFIEGEVGDTIKTENGQITEIQSINYDTNAITVSPAIDIVNGEGIALKYGGSAPDIGAHEYYSPGELTDLNDDGKVDLLDFAVLAAGWDDEDACLSPGWCGGADFNMSRTVDMFDLTYFAENWLR